MSNHTEFDLTNSKFQIILDNTRDNIKLENSAGEIEVGDYSDKISLNNSLAKINLSSKGGWHLDNDYVTISGSSFAVIDSFEAAGINSNGFKEDRIKFYTSGENLYGFSDDINTYLYTRNKEGKITSGAILTGHKDLSALLIHNETDTRINPIINYNTDEKQQIAGSIWSIVNNKELTLH